MPTQERFPATVSVALLLTHGRSKRLLLTRQKSDQEQWGLIAGGVQQGETAWNAIVRETWEEARIKEQNIIFVTGWNSLEPHVALIRGQDKIRLGLVFDSTYSGPRISLEGWEISDDPKVDRVKFFRWQEILHLLEDQSRIYRPEFNYPQLLRWLLKDLGHNPHRTITVDQWLQTNFQTIPGLQPKTDSPNSQPFKLADRWEYYSPYNQWMKTPGIHGQATRTNFARPRWKPKP